MIQEGIITSLDFSVQCFDDQELWYYITSVTINGKCIAFEAIASIYNTFDLQINNDLYPFIH